MAYTTGSAADMDAVKTALVNACTADGWTEQTDAAGKTVLSKSGIYVRIEHTVDTSHTLDLHQLALLGRTGLDAEDAPNVVMIGDWEDNSGDSHQIFPITYHIFTFISEVFMVVQSSDEYQWCAFGQSDQAGFSGTGNWVGATFGNGTYSRGGPMDITSSGGGASYGRTSGALFWSTDIGSSYVSANCWVHNDIESSYPWAFGNGDDYADPTGIKYLTELLDTQPNNYNLESVLMPIRAYKTRDASKISQIAEVKNARHVRIDNYTDEQIITLGTDDWMIFPYFKRDASNRDGGSGDHTGTFGWVIKKA